MLAMSVSSCSFEYIWKLFSGVMVASSTLEAFSFSSITCFRMVSADFRASFNVIDCKQGTSSQVLTHNSMLPEALNRHTTKKHSHILAISVLVGWILSIIVGTCKSVLSKLGVTTQEAYDVLTMFSIKIITSDNGGTHCTMSISIRNKDIHNEATAYALILDKYHKRRNRCCVGAFSSFWYNQTNRMNTS